MIEHAVTGHTLTGRTVTVIDPGPLATIQDQGRFGLAHLGVGQSGAADLPGLRQANLLVGNDSAAAAIEMTFGGIRLRYDTDALVALGGAPCEVRVGGRKVDVDSAFRVLAGEELRCRAPKIGVRTYLAIDGGIDVPPVLGSRSTDTLSGLGPQPLAAGMSLPLGARSTPPSAGPATPVPGAPADVGTADPAVEPAVSAFVVARTLMLLPGPRADWFTPAALELLFTTEWTVTPQADRVGIRLAGPPLTRRINRELPSEPMVAGALQVPPDGQPIVFLADHPVTGGYPVIGVVGEADLHHAAQWRPGTTIRFSSAHGQPPQH